MREAIGGALVLNIALIFIVLINGYLALSVQYTKAFRSNHLIINYIEQYEGFNDEAQRLIRDDLMRIGYNLDVTINCDNMLPRDAALRGRVIPGVGGRDNRVLYCVVQLPGPAHIPGTHIYRVTTFLDLNLPFIGEILSRTFRIEGETRLVFSGDLSD